MCISNKIVIGTAQFGMPYGIANQNGQLHENEIVEILNLARQSGIDSLDTAKIYGTSEEAIGKYLKKHSENSWEICTKISDGNSSLFHQFQDSIEKLSVCPTVLLAHSAKLHVDEAFQTELQRLKEEHAISKTGVSLYTEDEIKQVLKSDFKPDIIQLPLNILDTRLYHHDILYQLAQKGIEIYVRSAFLQGLFYLPKPELKNRFSGVVPYLEKLESIAADSGYTLMELSLLWLISLEEVSKVIIGVGKASHLEAHLQTLEKKIDASVFEEALSVHYENETVLNPSLWPGK